MPAIVCAVKIITMNTSSIYQVGDFVWNSPYSDAVIFSGPGSFNSGDGIRTITKRNETVINNPSNLDNSMIAST